MAKFQGIRVAVEDTVLQLTNSNSTVVNVQNETSGRLRIRATDSATLPSIADFNAFSYSLEPGQSAEVILAEAFRGFDPTPTRLHGLPDRAGNVIVDHD